MIITKVNQGESIEKALKRFKRKFNSIGITKELRNREQFTKPSEKRRDEVNKAKYVQTLRRKEEY